MRRPDGLLEAAHRLLRQASAAKETCQMSYARALNHRLFTSSDPDGDTRIAASGPTLGASGRLGALVGKSRAMRELVANLRRIAPLDTSVLIQGETGTGKELVARALHDASPRANAPFVVIDCGALPETLLHAELFGHSKGAYTGATNARAGAIESAHTGTVFLDEIG